MKKDFYDVLGVSRDASEREIKSAYKKKAMKYHPDRHQGSSKQEAEAKFKEINEAYSVLSNGQKRQAYDQFGDPNAAGQSPFGEGFGQEGFPDINDILNSFFGGGGGRSEAANFQGSDLAYTLVLSLEEAASGIEKTINVQKKETCDSCHGSGGQAGSKPTTCRTCHGRGKVTMQQGFMAIQQICPTCHGEGVTITSPCTKCHGKGCYNQKCQISIRIPSGVDNGDRMRVAGKGDAGIRNAPSGDLYINISVSEHSFFERDGVNLHCEVPISFYQSCVGGEVNVATLNGAVALKVPSETQSGSALRLKGKGIKSVRNNQVGDIICHITVETPVKLSKEQKRLLSDFEASLTDTSKQYPKTASFFNKVKSIIGK